MKNKLILVLILLILLPLATISAAIISKNVASVNLIRNTMIKEDDLNVQYELYRQEAIESGLSETITKRDVLEIMVNDELVFQGAERDGYKVSDAQLDSLINQQRAYVEQQVGQRITDAQFDQIIRNSYGVGLQEFRKSLYESSLIDLYVRGKMGSELENYPNPTEQQINEFFRTNRSAFINPELVRISHIFMPFDEKDKAEVKREMDMLARWIKYDTYTFEELVPKYSEDKDSINKGGDIGWLSFDDKEMRSYLGEKFFDDIFALKVGKPSGVLESNGGYHIIKVTIHTDPKLLSLNDTVNPDSKVTVKEYIENTLIDRAKQIAYLQAIEKLVKDLRQEGQVTILLEE